MRAVVNVNSKVSMAINKKSQVCETLLLDVDRLLVKLMARDSKTRPLQIALVSFSRFPQTEKREPGLVVGGPRRRPDSLDSFFCFRCTPNKLFPRPVPLLLA
jgi:hypothetical protein